jgi:hypothetical protein
MNEYGAMVKCYKQEKPELLGKETCPSAILYTTNPTWTDLGSNLGFRVEKVTLMDRAKKYGHLMRRAQQKTIIFHQGNVSLHSKTIPTQFKSHAVRWFQLCSYGCCLKTVSDYQVNSKVTALSKNTYKL